VRPNLDLELAFLKTPHAVQRESDLVGAWTYKGLDEIYNEAKGHLKKKSWKDLRPALATTIKYVQAPSQCHLF
jgi:hypothetical protein